MLQQTQVQTVLGYFERFIQRFASIEALACAEEDEVLALWSGLGYYSRARNLHTCAKIIVQNHQGLFPQTLESLGQLPGIGPSTAAAILSQAFDLPTAILDANVKRVLARFFLIKGYPEQSQVKKTLWELAQSCMPKTQCAEYTQAIMDLGALCCTNKQPNCLSCPLKENCLAFEHKEQHLCPGKKSKKPVPTKEEQFLVLINKKGAIYLEKRPPTGIWGGLWCLPTLTLAECPLKFIESEYSLEGGKPELLTRFKHQFSHFHLEIHALRITTKPLANKVREAAGDWFTPEALSNLGLAKPTQTILALARR